MHSCVCLCRILLHRISNVCILYISRFGIIQRKKVDATMSNVENVHFGLLNPRGIAVDPFAE